jgi:hypothetical protein
MGWLGAGSASSRRTMVAVLLAGFSFTAVSVQAQDASAPAAQAPAAPDPFKFTTDAAVMSFYVKPDQTAAFEGIWSAIRGGLAASAKPELKALGDGLKVYKAAAPPTENGVVYYVVADPVDKTLSYSPSPFLLFEAGLFDDATARKYFEQLQAALNGIIPAGVNNAAPPVAPPPPAAAPAPAAPAAQ